MEETITPHQEQDTVKMLSLTGTVAGNQPDNPEILEE